MNKTAPVSSKAPIGKSHSGNEDTQNSTSRKDSKDSKDSKAGNSKDSRLEEFFHDEVKDIYWAEKQLVKTLPKMAKAATGEELKNAFTRHLEVTKGHVTRLEKIFEILGQEPKAKKCEAMAGITDEGESIIGDTEAGTATRDVGLILAGQKAEHYEIATYSGLAEIARTLGHIDIAKIMETTLAEEKEADEGLKGLAVNKVNAQASQEKE